MSSSTWWASALSEAVNGERPLPVVYDGEELVLFRNTKGQALALEDRCPHRRVPLALGCVVGDAVQCGYHGWIFDGTTGACTEIPNLHADERVPPRYAARAYPVAEQNGFVHVWLGDGEPCDSLPAASYQPRGREFTGSTVVSLPHDEYLAVMLDGPECLIDFEGVKITDFFLGDPVRRENHLVLDRGAVWATQLLPANFVVDYPLIVRTCVPLVGGDVRVDLLTSEENPICSVFVASGANRRSTTSLCWRGFMHDHDVETAPLHWRARRATRRPPFSVSSEIDGAQIAALLVAPSRDLTFLRQQSLIPATDAV